MKVAKMTLNVCTRILVELIAVILDIGVKASVTSLYINPFFLTFLISNVPFTTREMNFILFERMSTSR